MEYAYEFTPEWWASHRKFVLVYLCLAALRGWAAEWCRSKEHPVAVGIHARGSGYSIWFMGSQEQCEELGQLVIGWQQAVETIGTLDEAPDPT